MTLHYDFIEYKIDSFQLRNAIIDIIEEDIGCEKDIVEKIVYEYDLDDNTKLIEILEDKLLDYFYRDASEYASDCEDYAEYKRTFDYGAKGTFGD